MTSKYSRRFPERSATVSPALRPEARSASIRRFVRSCRAAQLVVPASSTSAGAPGFRAAVSARRRAMLRTYRRTRSAVHALPQLAVPPPEPEPPTIMKQDAIRDKVAIVGMGCSKFGENWDKDPQDMIVEAAYEAYADAGLDDPQRQIEAVFCGAQYPSKGTAEVADALKLYDRPVSMVVNYCATGTDAFRYGVF